MTPALIKKLELSFAVGCTDLEACFDAGISHQALYNYQKKHPEFVERKEGLKRRPITVARNTVIQELKNDVNTAKWYLERKKKDEFAPLYKTEHSGNIGIDMTEDEIDKELADLEAIESAKVEKVRAKTGKGKV